VKLASSDIRGRGIDMTPECRRRQRTTLDVAPGNTATTSTSMVVVIDPRNPATSDRTPTPEPGKVRRRLDGHEGRPRGAVADHLSLVVAQAVPADAHLYAARLPEWPRDLPVFYLLHGAGVATTHGPWAARASSSTASRRAKARPMVVVMPAGHTGRSISADLGQRPMSSPDLLNDVIPISNRLPRSHRPQEPRVGLSMGGGQTLNIGIEPGKLRISRVQFGRVRHHAAVNAPAGGPG
jgi:hypothetical protein